MPGGNIIVVFGATGRQGGSVARALSSNPSFHVRALVRDPESPAAKQLTQDGIELVQGDLNDKESLVNALTGAYGCFLVTATNFSEPVLREVERGRNAVEACVAARIEHLVLSTQLCVEKTIGIRAKQLDAKFTIQEIAQTMRLPHTGVIVPFYFENFLDVLKPERCDGHLFKLNIPLGHTPMDGMSVFQLGDIVRSIFLAGPRFIGKVISVTADKLTVKEYGAILSRQLAPYIVKDAQITVDQFKEFGILGGAHIGNMFEFFVRVDQKHSIEISRQLCPDILNFEEWVMLNKEAFQHALDLDPNPTRRPKKQEPEGQAVFNIVKRY